MPLPSGYRFCEDLQALDVDRMHRWLSEESYWAAGRDRETVRRSLAGSHPVGVLDADARQVAMARLVSDGVTFAWLCDVFVDRDHRGRGLGHALAAWALDWARRHGVYRVLLATRDAHDVYRANGFTPLPRPDEWMIAGTASTTPDAGTVAD